MKTLTGQLFNTQFGLMLIPENQKEAVNKGDIFLYQNEIYKVLYWIPPSRPTAKQSICIEKIS